MFDIRCFRHPNNRQPSNHIIFVVIVCILKIGISVADRPAKKAIDHTSVFLELRGASFLCCSSKRLSFNVKMTFSDFLPKHFGG